MYDFMMFLAAFAVAAGVFCAGYYVGCDRARAKGYEDGVDDTVEVLVGTLERASDAETFDAEKVRMDLRSAIDKGVNTNA